jgi:hypothetical protein
MSIACVRVQATVHMFLIQLFKPTRIDAPAESFHRSDYPVLHAQEVCYNSFVESISKLIKWFIYMFLR